MPVMSEPTRWVTETDPGHSQWYIERFRQMRAEGADLDGEARLLDAIVPPSSRLLDAGCGPGRVAAALSARGHQVVGVDADEELVDAAGRDHPGPRWIVADLATLDLAAHGEPEPFDAVVVAGNVMTFLAPGTERDVLARLASHVHPDGAVVVGFGTDRGYAVADFDGHSAAAGLVLEQRFATWDLRPWSGTSTFCVTILRKPHAASGPPAGR